MKISIQSLLKEKHISRYKLARLVDVSYPTITKMYDGTAVVIRLDVLENMCKIFECTPNDILIPDSEFEQMNTDEIAATGEQSEE